MLNAIVPETEKEYKIPRYTENSTTASSPQDEIARHPGDDTGITCDLPNFSTNNMTTTITPTKKQGAESHCSESSSKGADIELDIFLRELR